MPFGISRGDVIGIAVGVIIGLPGFVDYFFGDQTALGVLSALIGILIVLGIFGLRWLLNQPPFTILNTEKTLKFEDEHGYKASHVDVREVRANHKGPTEYWFKELGVPEALRNILVDDSQPDAQETELGLHRVCKRFQHALGWRESFSTKLTLNIVGAFPNTRETYIHKVVDSTKEAKLRIEFHPSRPCVKAKVYLGYGGGSYEPLENARFTRSDNGKELELRLKKPQRGQYYRVEWDW